jgi:hypothetical protein
MLVDAGDKPDTRLNIYRGDTLALKVRSIGEAAGLEVGGDGVGFRHNGKPGAAPLVRLNEGEATPLPPAAKLHAEVQ